MNLGQRFDTSSPVESNYNPIPEGTYKAQIVGEKTTTTSKGGTMLTLEFSIIENPQYANRRVYNNYNIICDSETAQNIAVNEIKQLAYCCNLPNIEDTSELITKMCMIKVAIQKQPGYNDKNIIKGYMKIGANESTTPANNAPVNSNIPAWRR